MATRSNSQVGNSFDSMSEMIENLAVTEVKLVVGILILLLLLFLQLTHEKGKDTGPPPVERGSAAPAELDGKTRLVQLEKQVGELHSEVRRVDRDIQALDQRQPEIQKEVEALFKKAGAVPPKGNPKTP